MKGLTVLKRTACDVRALPLGAREAFFLSQLDGSITLEEATESAGLAIEEATKIAEKLLDLGAVTTMESRPPASVRRGPTEGRADPRAEHTSMPPRQKKRTSRPPDSRVEKVSLRPSPTPSRRPTPKPEKRRSSASNRGMKAAGGKEAPVNEVCELDATVQAAIIELDKKVLSADLYTALGVERTADKKTIKRAYFAFAAKYHPDRFFGKKLGGMRIPLARLFHRLTEANDTLTDAALRAVYDASLPPLPAAEAPKAPAEAPKDSPPRRASKAAMRAASRQMKAVKGASVPPASARASKSPPASRASKSLPPNTTVRLDMIEIPNTPVVIKPIDDAARSSSFAPITGTSTPVPTSSKHSPAPTSGAPSSAERTRQLRAAAMGIKMQSAVENLVKAAEALLKSGDIVGAANNYRLALSHSEDPYLRIKFEDLDARARIVRFEKSLTMAKAAEKDNRWSDAATCLVRALDARVDAEVAARAAKALRLAAGDLMKAAAVAEQAVSLDSRNLAYRIELVEVYIAQGRFPRAESALADALEIAPKDARLKELQARVAEQRKKT